MLVSSGVWIYTCICIHDNWSNDLFCFLFDLPLLPFRPSDALSGVGLATTHDGVLYTHSRGFRCLDTYAW
jgi:hypothetical protein